MNTDKIYAESIAKEYAPKEASKVIALKKLDRKAKSGANIFAYSFGIVMTMVLGIGMCLCLGVIGGSNSGAFVAGIIIGLLGIVGLGLNYPIYKKLLEKGKNKYAFEILELAKRISEAEE